MFMKIGKHIIPAAMLALLAAQGAALAEEPLVEQKALGEQLQHGRRLSEANCQRCHSVHLEGNSTHPDAPPFWSISARRPAETVAQMLLDHVKPDGTDMPTFEITDKQAMDIAAWINWVQPTSHGKRLVKENCASCHSVEQTGESPREDAPPFRNLQKRYPIDALEEAFAEGIESGHPDMPIFETDITQLSDILSYIASLDADE